MKATGILRRIDEQLENGYERGVVVELVELCEKLVGINAPKTEVTSHEG